MKRVLVLVVAASAVLGLTGAALSTSRDVWKQLHRPLHIPRIAPGSPCPASGPDTSVDFLSYGVGQGFGPGPAYPIFFGRPTRAAIEFEYPPPPDSLSSGSKWGAQKVLWFLLPGNGDRVLVRGRQLDGPYGVRFGQGLLPVPEMRIAHPLDHPSTTRLRTGGCYGYQIDGPSYSRVVVFEAKLNCLATAVHGNEVHAGPLTGLVYPEYDIVEGRFRLHVGGYRDRATGLSQKIPWLLPRSYRVGSSLVVQGRRLAPPGRTFTQKLPEAVSSDSPDQHVFPSIIRPPSAGCWHLTFRTGHVTGSLVVLVRG